MNARDVGPRRVLFVINAFEKDAPTRITLAAARELRKLGWHVAVVAWSRGGKLSGEFRAAGFPATVLSRWRPSTLEHIIRHYKPHVVHSMLVRPTLGVFATRLFGLRKKFAWVAGDHGLHEWYERGHVVGAAMERIMPAVYATADAVTSVSEAASQRLTAAGVPADRIQVIPNGVDTTVFYPRSRRERCALISRLFQNDDPAMIWPLIGSAGNLRPVKGYADLLQAMPAVLRSFPNARLVIWGSGPLRQGLEQLRHELQLEDAVVLPGYEDSLPALLPLLDLYVQPSHEESFGLAAAQAMSCGVPSLLSDAGGLAELANNGVAAATYPSGDVTRLESRLVQLLESKNKLAALGKAGRGFVLSRYSQAQMGNRLDRFYRDLSATCGREHVR